MTDICASPWLSIVLPVYNVKPYLAACLASIADQWQPGVELIAVEDCSTDGSREELARLRQTLVPQLKIIEHVMNRGLSGARNTGLDAAVGTYVWFLDSDDVLGRGALESLRAIVQRHGPDLVLCDFQVLRMRMRLKHKWRGELHRRTFTGASGVVGSDPMELIAGVFEAGHLHTWSKIARRSLWGTDLRFPEGKYFEDAHTTPELLCRARSFYHAPETWVLYRQREGSILNQMDSRKLDDMTAAFLGWRLPGPPYQSESGANHARFAVSLHLVRNFTGASKHFARMSDGVASRAMMASNRQRLELTMPLTPRVLVIAFLKRGWGWRAIRFVYWFWRSRQLGSLSRAA